MSDRPKPGSIMWRDLTVEDAARVRDFYAEVVGWRAEPVDMGEYSDFNMLVPGSGECTAGICHARGGNAGLPAQWLMYITVDNIDRSLERCTALGGRVIAGPTKMGDARYCVIADPAGAVCALYQPAP